MGQSKAHYSSSAQGVLASQGLDISRVSCFIFQIFVNTYSRKEKSVSFLSMIPSFFFKNKGSEWIYEI